MTHLLRCSSRAFLVRYWHSESTRCARRASARAAAGRGRSLFASPAPGGTRLPEVSLVSILDPTGGIPALGDVTDPDDRTARPHVSGQCTCTLARFTQSMITAIEDTNPRRANSAYNTVTRAGSASRCAIGSTTHRPVLTPARPRTTDGSRRADCGNRAARSAHALHSAVPGRVSAASSGGVIVWERRPTQARPAENGRAPIWLILSRQLTIQIVARPRAEFDGRRAHPRRDLRAEEGNCARTPPASAAKPYPSLRKSKAPRSSVRLPGSSSALPAYATLDLIGSGRYAGNSSDGYGWFRMRLRWGTSPVGLRSPPWLCTGTNRFSCRCSPDVNSLSEPVCAYVQLSPVWPPSGVHAGD